MTLTRRIVIGWTLLAGALPAQNSLEVIAAYYGASRNFVDVTSAVRAQAQQDGLGMTVNAGTLGGDPFPGQAKTLRLYYKLNGEFQQGEWRDNDSVAIGRVISNIRGGMRGRNERNQIERGRVSPLTIVQASYGAGTRNADVTARMTARITANRLVVLVNNENMGGDPQVGVVKTLTVNYEWNGQRLTASAKEGETLSLPVDAALGATGVTATGVTTTGSIVSLPTDGVCFYPDKNYQGTAVCAVWGQDQPRVNTGFGSVRLLGSVRVLELFESGNYQGRSLRLTADQPDLSRTSSGFFGTPVTWAPNPGSFRMGQ